MERFVITIRPKPSDADKLRVTDAMQQVLDALKLFDRAQENLASPHERFEWRLERASTNSPFTVVAIAEPRNPTVNVDQHAREVKTQVVTGLRSLLSRGIPPAWMDQATVRVAQEIFERNRNGIGYTDIDIEIPNAGISIDESAADAGLQAIEAVNISDVGEHIGDRTAFGEIEGLMLAAGRFRRRPAIQIRSDLYGYVWCTLSDPLIKEFGSEHSIREVWEGQMVGVTGIAHYGEAGKLQTIEAHRIRGIQSAEPIDLDAILDPDFTAGMDPHEYLDKLHEGELA